MAPEEQALFEVEPFMVLYENSSTISSSPLVGGVFWGTANQGASPPVAIARSQQLCRHRFQDQLVAHTRSFLGKRFHQPILIRCLV
jgi:hypothetical protein